ncbi:uncharacterized protein [Montipora foliosa]|uniref:uncharacterized protein isoform X1 n=1 Tax=Montipora foliosa TaxID=591990 RepID=UPI0035F16379
MVGNAVCSRSRYSALCETAIFGRACRHEFPKRFINVKQGERLAYPVWILNNLLDEISSQSLNVCILYDVACLFETHLQNALLRLKGSTTFCSLLSWQFLFFIVMDTKRTARLSTVPGEYLILVLVSLMVKSSRDFGPIFEDLEK